MVMYIVVVMMCWFLLLIISVLVMLKISNIGPTKQPVMNPGLAVPVFDNIFFVTYIVKPGKIIVGNSKEKIRKSEKFHRQLRNGYLAALTYSL